MTSATDRLRALLTERGVEWTEPTDEYWELLGGMPTRNYVTIIGEKYVEEALDGTLVAYPLTPEQAVAATLGPGACEVEGSTKLGWEPYYEHDLSCGHTVTSEWPEPPRFCPECGRRVVG